jgi:Na+-driven multidrug efflux pump
MLRCFFFFTTFGDSLSTTAQAFLPGFLVNNNRLAIGKVVRRLVIISVGVGGLNAAAAGLIPCLLPNLFTNSAEIILEMQALAPWLSGSLLAHACTMALEGILLAERELSYLASSYALNTLLVVGGLWALQHVNGGSIHGVWGCLLFFQVSRLTFFAMRLLLKHGLLKRGWRKVKHILTARGWGRGRSEEDGGRIGEEGAVGG